MKQDILPHFIVIDDDPVNNMICLKIIQLVVPGVVVQAFTHPEKGMEYILSIGTKKAILFLDINMPELTGWEVLDRMNDFPDMVKAHLTTFILSSSVASDDLEKANQAPLVAGYIVKPLSQVELRSVFNEWQTG